MSAQARYYDGVSAVAHRVSILHDQTSLIITGGGRSLRWPYSEIRVADKHRGTFERGKEQLTIEDRQLAKMLIALLPRNGKARGDRSFIIHIMVLAGVVLATVFVLIPLLSPLVVPYLPTSFDKHLGRYAMKTFSTLPRCEGKEGLDAANALVARLASSVGTEHEYEVTLINRSMVNALALPGGQIVLFRGLIDKASGPDELAGILAHEIGHVEKRHGTEALVRATMTSFMLDVVTGGGGTLVYMGAQIRDLSYSREREAEADQFARKLMAKQKIDPRGMAQFFERMQAQTKQREAKKEKDGGYDMDGLWKFLSTHPGDNDRASAARKAYDAKTAYRPAMRDAEWNALRTACSAKAAPPAKGVQEI